MQCTNYTVYSIHSVHRFLDHVQLCSTMAGHRPNNAFEMFENCNLLKDFAVLIWSFQTIEKMASVLSVTNFSWIGTRAFQWEASQPKGHLNNIWFKLNITILNYLNHKMWFIIMNNVYWTSWCRSSWWISEDSEDSRWIVSKWFTRFACLLFAKFARVTARFRISRHFDFA